MNQEKSKKRKPFRYVVYFNTELDAVIVQHLARFTERRRSAEMRRLMRKTILSEKEGKA
jgi:hypothetical protein